MENINAEVERIYNLFPMLFKVDICENEYLIPLGFKDIDDYEKVKDFCDRVEKFVETFLEWARICEDEYKEYLQQYDFESRKKDISKALIKVYLLREKD